MITSAISLERKSKITTNNHKQLPASAVFSCTVLNYGIWVMTVKDHPDETRHSGQARSFPSSERRPRNGWSDLFWLFFFTHQQAGTIRSCFNMSVMWDGSLCTAAPYCWRGSRSTAVRSGWSYWGSRTVHRHKPWCENRPSYGFEDLNFINTPHVWSQTRAPRLLLIKLNYGAARSWTHL